MSTVQSPTRTRLTPIGILLLSQGTCTCLSPVECDRCLERVASFLVDDLETTTPRSFQKAEEMLRIALDRTTEWYRAKLGDDLCTMERARTLRRMTVRVVVDRNERALERPRYIADNDESQAVATKSTVPAWVPKARPVYRILAHPVDWLRAAGWAVLKAVVWVCLAPLVVVYLLVVLVAVLVAIAEEDSDGE